MVPSFQIQPIPRIATIILSGGEGKRLRPLTHSRCKPAVSFGGRYTLIDIPLSHALLSGISQIYVIGQYMAHSLGKHLAKSYGGLLGKEIQLLVPKNSKGYEGTADAIRQNLSLFSTLDVDYFLVLSGDQLYNIDFQEMIAFGKESGASLVIATQAISEKEAKRMGVMKLQSHSTKVDSFVEKPQEKALLEKFCNGENTYLGSMGIYLFKKQSLVDLLLADSRADFGMHLIGTELERGEVHSFIYKGYWEDIGTIASYYHANLALTKQRTGIHFNCYDEKKVIMTQSYHLPGARLGRCVTEQAILCEGSIIEGAEISNAVVGVRSQIEKGVTIRDAILMGNSDYQSAVIGEGSVIKGAIIDENVRVGKSVRLVNEARLDHYDHPHKLIYVREGIIVVPANTTLPKGFVF